MKILAIIISLMLLLSILGCGCTSTTDYQYSGGETQYTTPSASASGVKYSYGDIVQRDLSHESFNPAVAAVITGTGNDSYQYHLLYWDSTNRVWVKAEGRSGSSLFSDLETALPNKIGHVDPDSLMTKAVPTSTVTTSAPAKVAATPTIVSGRDRLQILSHNIEYGGYGDINVVGTAKNIGSNRISMGTVEVKFYDRDGSVLGNSLDVVQDLDPGETWRFNAMYIDLDGTVQTYKIGVGTVV